MNREQAHDGFEPGARAGSRRGREPERSDHLGEEPSPRTQFLLSLQPSAGNRAVSGLAQRLRDGPRHEGVLQRASDAAPRESNDTGLPDGLKSGIESLSGVSLDDVRVHYGSSRPAQLDALAYAQGNEVHVAPGQEQHLAHEAWHVVQQAQGRVQATGQLEGGVAVNNDEGLEREADAMGAKASAPSDRSSVTQRVPTRGGPAVVQRVLGVDRPLKAVEIKNVDRKQPTLVYILDGYDSDSVVVKFEMPGKGEKLPQFRGRRQVLHGLARDVLEHVPEATELHPLEVEQLRGLDRKKVTGDVGDLLDNLEKGLAKESVALKMEKANVGLSLHKMIETGNVTQGLITDTVLRQLGRMAFFDLLVSNSDRFAFSGKVMVRNIDFTSVGDEVVPLDNVDPNNSGVLRGLEEWQERARVETTAVRRDYAEDALSNLCQETKDYLPWPKERKEMVRLTDVFAAGMEDEARLCKAQEKRLLEAQFGSAPAPRGARGGARGQGVPTEEKATPVSKVAEGLANRLRLIKL